MPLELSDLWTYFAKHECGEYSRLYAQICSTVAADAAPDTSHAVMLSMTPFRKLIKDYFLVCETYYQAIRTAPPARIQAIDMGRRALHNDGSKLLAERLAGKLGFDHDTARRLFTLICALHWKG